MSTSQRISRETWEQLATDDPWRAVLTNVDGRAVASDAEAREAFYRSGEEHVKRVFSAIRTHFGETNPEVGVDFGCGVGRTIVPLARRCSRVIATDIAPTMLSIAADRLQAEGVSNATLQPSQDFVREETPIDLFHSFLVLQHIWPDDGMRILGSVLPRIRAGGIVAIHVPYRVGGKRPRLPFRWARSHMPFFNAAANVIRGVPAKTPFMQMNAYDLNAVIGLLGDLGFGTLLFLPERQPDSDSVIILGRREQPSPG
jgi:2-polyprenyl-3-methyl-5-hydroxy-6-metoxy-1,4-benzoquinol methylase